MGIFGKLFKAAANELANGDAATSRPRSGSVGSGHPPVAQEYFARLERLEAFKRKSRYSEMLQECRATLDLVPEFVRWSKEDDKRLGITDFQVGIKAIDIGCRYWAALQDTESLKFVEKTVSCDPDLKQAYASTIERARTDMELSGRIQAHLRDNPGMLQRSLGKAMGVSGRDTSRIIQTLENLGRVARAPSGKTYELRLRD